MTSKSKAPLKTIRSYKPDPTGYLILKMPHGSMTVVGGPFDAFEGGIGVCLESASSKRDKADILFPIHDFTAPEVEDLETLISKIVLTHEQAPDQPVFVGCRGGFGRTGTVVAGLVKYSLDCTGQEAVAYTRQHFNGGAVETKKQEEVVNQLEPLNVRLKVAMMTIKNAVAPSEAESDYLANLSGIRRLWDRAIRFLLAKVGK